MIKPSQEYFNQKETAQYLGLNVSTVKRDYLSWKQYGVNPSRYRNGKTRLMFRKKQLDQMVEQWRVIHG